MEPTVITKVNKKMKVLKEEVFGPVSPILLVNSVQEAIEKANNSKFGLGASIWTQNIVEGVKISKKIDSGMVNINEMIKSDPRLPFGGIKESGIGRELSAYGLKEFVNIKSIIVNRV